MSSQFFLFLSLCFKAHFLYGMDPPSTTPNPAGIEPTAPSLTTLGCGMGTTGPSIIAKAALAEWASKL